MYRGHRAEAKKKSEKKRNRTPHPRLRARHARTPSTSGARDRSNRSRRCYTCYIPAACVGPGPGSFCPPNDKPAAHSAPRPHSAGLNSKQMQAGADSARPRRAQAHRGGTLSPAAEGVLLVLAAPSRKGCVHVTWRGGEGRGGRVVFCSRGWECGAWVPFSSHRARRRPGFLSRVGRGRRRRGQQTGGLGCCLRTGGRGPLGKRGLVPRRMVFFLVFFFPRGCLWLL